MGVKMRFVALSAVFAILCLVLSAPEAKAQGETGSAVRKMTVTGQVGKVANGYVVRGTERAVIFTVLNPEPNILDGLAESGKTVVVEVAIVSGDNVNIETINGEPYPQKTGGSKSPQP